MKSLHEQCPVCFFDLRGSVIPNTEPPEYYSHLRGVEIAGLYDGILFWECPNCDSRFHRFRAGTDLWQKARIYVGE